MKKLFYAICVFCTLLFVSCTKDDDTKPNGGGTSCTTGTLKFVNNSDNPYNVYIDGSYERQMSGNSSFEKEIGTGTYFVKAIQVSGYVLYPTERSTDLTISGCSTTGWSFP